jgi:N-acetylmuramoyl-L-alanine amidase
LLSSGIKFAGPGFSVWPRRRTIVAAIAALMLLPIEVGDAAWLSDIFKSSSKHGKSPTHVAVRKPAARPTVSPKHHAVKLAALGPAALSPSALRPNATTCDPANFRIVLDVGHTAESEGATSARNIPEFNFNLRLAQRIQEKLKAEGFAETKLLVTEGKARSSLVKRVAAANNLNANFFLSIHHDSVPDKMLEDWEFEGKKSHFSDQRLFRLRVPQQSGLQDEPLVCRTAWQGNEDPGPAICRAIYPGYHGSVPASAAEQGNRGL